MDWYKLAPELLPDLKRGNLDACIKRAQEELGKLPRSDFHMIKDLDFTNDPKNIAGFIDNFIISLENKIELKALYTETNGFDINPERWYFELFAYKEHGGNKNYDWLSNYVFISENDMKLTGMENLQRIFVFFEKEHIYLDASQKHQQAKGLASLLVVLKFQRLIKKSAPFVSKLKCPLLVTSHDYDFIYEFIPKSNKDN